MLLWSKKLLKNIFTDKFFQIISWQLSWHFLFFFENKSFTHFSRKSFCENLTCDSGVDKLLYVCTHIEFLNVITIFTWQAYSLAVVICETLYHIVVFPLNTIFRFFSVMSIVIFLCNSVFSPYSFRPRSGFSLAESDLCFKKKHLCPPSKKYFGY